MFSQVHISPCYYIRFSFSLKFFKTSLAVFIPVKIQLSVPYTFCILVYGAFSASPTSFS